MDIGSWKEKVSNWLKKYKYAALVLLIGIVLLMIPGKEEEQREAVITHQADNRLSVEEELSRILSMVHGAGEVQVMLTVSTGEQTLYQTNNDYATDANGSQEKTDTVTVTDSQRNETGLIRQVNPPIYLGAVIVCEGADNPAVRLSITEAVSRITGLGTDKISVLKMK